MAHKVYRLIEKESVMETLTDTEKHRFARRWERLYHRDGNLLSTLEQALKACKAEIVKVKHVR